MSGEYEPSPEEMGLDPKDLETDKPSENTQEQSPKAETSKGDEFNFDEVKRPLTINDVRDFQRQFRAFDDARREKGRKYIIGENQFYEYLSSGTFYGVERPNGGKVEALTEQGKQGYDDLLLTYYKAWRESLIKNKGQVAQFRPEVIKQLGDLDQLPNPQTAEELRDLYAAMPQLNTFSAAAYQAGVDRGSANNPFLHFQGHRHGGYQYERPDTEIRLYLKPPINEVPKMAQEFIRAADERSRPYYFKLIDFSLQEPEPADLKRVDRMIFYADKGSAAKIVGIFKELQEQNPEWFADRPLPPLTAKIMDGVGAAEEPSDYQHKRFSGLGKERTSFNSVRAGFLNRLWLGTIRNIILQNPELRPRGSRTLKQIFNDLVPPVNRHYLDSLWGSNLNPPEGHQERTVLNSTLARTMVDVVPDFTSESLLPWLDLGTKRLAPEFGIDPDNLAFNKAA
jgi:hypothetical protein